MAAATEGVECGPDPFPPFHNPGCMADDECAITFHMADCCGTIEVWGIGADQIDTFNVVEEMCAPKPVCDCAPKPTTADDGKTAEDPNSFDIACIDNKCESFVP